MVSIEECVTQPSIIRFAFNELTIDKSADKWTAKCKICKQKLLEKRGIIILCPCISSPMICRGHRSSQPQNAAMIVSSLQDCVVAVSK